MWKISHILNGYYRSAIIQRIFHVVIDSSEVGALNYFIKVKTCKEFHTSLGQSWNFRFPRLWEFVVKWLLEYSYKN